MNRPMQTSSLCPRASVVPPRRHLAFTLTELLVAVSLIVVLMLAVNVIFKSTADTISAGQALSTAMRDMRSVQSIMKKDLDGAAMDDGPFFMIRSSVIAAFKNQKDELSDVDTNKLTAALTGGGETDVSTTDYGTRTFRQDILGFFSRGLFQRQTGNNGTFAAPMSSNEAYVWYGHLWLPTNNDPTIYNNWFTDLAATYPPGSNAAYPGWGTVQNNPNNFYASQWILGREALLLRQPEPSGTDFLILNNGTRQFYVGRAPSAGITDLAPLSAGSRSTEYGRDGTFAGNPQVLESRYDLVGKTISGYRSILASAIPNFTPGNFWWDDAHFGYRFQANPFPSRPLTSASAAQTAPIFVPNCSQFIVEYTGDFITQNAQTGQYTAATPDGVADWQVAGFVRTWNAADAYAGGDVVCNIAFNRIYRCKLANTNQAVTDATYWEEVTADPAGALPKVTRKPCWYGLPRDINGDGRIWTYADVVPLRDYASAAQGFERVTPLPQNDYATKPYNVAVSPNGGLAPGEQYICAWGPDLPAGTARPTMLRILIKPEDPNGKVDVPWQEMIFKLP